MAVKKTFEENMARLEQIVALLEKGDAQLTDSLALFEEGTKLAAQCRKELDGAEQKVVKLAKGAERAMSQLDTMVTDLVERRMDL